MTTYTHKELRRAAVKAIRDEAKGAVIRAKLLDYSITTCDNEFGGRAYLTATGMRTDSGHPGYVFDVKMAI